MYFFNFLTSLTFSSTWKINYAISFVEGDSSAIDFETKMYADSMDVLEHHIKPVRSVPGVVLEQAYLNKMSEGLRPFCQLASNKCKFYFLQKQKFPSLFIPIRG